MRSTVVYFSKFGNTQKVAEAIASVLEASGTVRVISTNQLSASELDESDLIIMGSPTHRMNLPEVVRPVLESLPRRILRGKLTAAFDTSYKMSMWLAPFTAAPKLAQKLRRLGGKRVIPPETFHVVGKDGPLYDGELERAKKWTALILQRAEAQKI